MELYHITCNEYPLGQLIPLPDKTLYHENAIAIGLDWIDNYLDSFKPSIAPSRSKTFYAFGEIQHCLAYFNTRICDNGTKRLYKIFMDNPYSSPMCLTDGLKNNGIGHKSNELIANEYWNPKNQWKVLEFLSEKMIIQEDITDSIKNLPQFGTFFYGEDIKLRKQLFNC